MGKTQFNRRVPFSLFVNIPLTTPRINFRISECHHRFSIDLILIFSAKNGKLFLDHTDPLKEALFHTGSDKISFRSSWSNLAELRTKECFARAILGVA